ncbi:16S rRNA (cytidine(1402)-2'-O)-methyltransferase [Collinsella stercoris]|uniref:Ribosomal RNA small subunit methyltransferase I n=1 Tax=Collinsella stercoris DSM 13279 TaxID=445975 RepID=B6G7M6_9ACTN|nr:16S rRNA (cytidine(1402)-2'-O)-methyltransferase [Collinsella stercoris]EEA91723.1 S-adenosylmethionine-dependent methyltransferase, YraL family [Collinsella stercoris DSM 13279]UEA44976.1 16S rRNA (cytidine(1402)-2'-O)-methyltransferase [Collinsella stercoris DSM 13279]UWP12501.1 16S rRNA (cytidine(1402)-2'-O)-methyltransferase [Collinsella stercoris]
MEAENTLNAGGGAGGMLSLVGTPIGNLGDLSARAAETFRRADAVCCEDTRVTGKLLAYLGISKPLVRCDDNVIERRAPELVGRVLAGERIAFASDAGMPSVSDPGQVLVELARCEGAPVEVIPGPSACVTALVLSGMPSDQFFFEGFLPRKHGERVRRLQRLAPVPGALIFYESPHRVEASLKAIAEVFPQRTVALCRELTKLHEEVLRAPAPELHEQVLERGELKGEMVIVVAPPSEDELDRLEAALAAGASIGAPVDPDELLRSDIAEGLSAGDSANALAKRLAQKYSRKKRDVYNLALELQG